MLTGQQGLIQLSGVNTQMFTSTITEAKRRKVPVALVWDGDNNFASFDLFVCDFVTVLSSLSGVGYIHDASWKCTSSDAHSSTSAVSERTLGQAAVQLPSQAANHRKLAFYY